VEPLEPLEPMTLTGRHVRLEPLRIEHAEALAAAASEDRATYEWTRVPDGLEATRDYIAIALDGWAAGTELPFAQVRLSDGTVVGSTRFLNVERWAWEGSDGAPDVVEIGATWLAASAQRTAINSEAKLLLMTHAFEGWRVQRLWFKTDGRNERSRAAILRLGATFEGLLRNHMPAYGRPGVRDSACYSVLPGEWPSVKARLEAAVTR
jgi:RimJ/RimL family protein N-acetyltransferase